MKIMNVILSIQIANYNIVRDQHKYTVSEHTENNECDFINTVSEHNENNECDFVNTNIL